jgi:hypothetical protein
MKSNRREHPASDGVVWIPIEGTYASQDQRLSEEPNQVLQLNLDARNFKGKHRVVVDSIRELSVMSGHPVWRRGNAFTVGWVRFTDFPDCLLIEEIQTDLFTVKKELKSEEFCNQFVEVTCEDIAETLPLLDPWLDGFYTEAMRHMKERAAQVGKRLEMLSYEQKKHCGAPKSVYTDVPKAAGMKLRKGTFPEIGKVWIFEAQV